MCIQVKMDSNGKNSEDILYFSRKKVHFAEDSEFYQWRFLEFIDGFDDWSGSITVTRWLTSRRVLRLRSGGFPSALLVGP